MNYNSYLNSNSVKESCREYIEILEKDNEKNIKYLEIISRFIYDDSSKGQAINALKELLSYYSSAVGSLYKANELDIEDAKILTNRIEDEIIIGSVVLEGKISSARDEEESRHNASERYREAYTEPDLNKAEMLRKQGKIYDGLATSACIRKMLFEKKEKKYDDINRETENLFIRAEEMRNNVSNLLGILQKEGITEECEKIRKRLKALNNYYGNDKKEIEIIWDIALVEKTIDKSTSEGREVAALYEEKKAYENAIEKDPSQANYFKKKIAMVDEKIEQTVNRALEKSKRSEELTYVYDYLKKNKYTEEERLSIFTYWMSLEGEEEISGKEMPKWWMESHLNPGGKYRVTEENYDELQKSEEMRNWYYQGYFIVDAISGQPGVEEDISSHDFIEASKAEANSPIHFEDAYRNWFEYSYGAIDDYRSGVGTIRATKYALDKKLGFYNLIEEKGAYKTYTNDDTTLYEFAVEMYISKYQHADHYYKKIMGKISDKTDDVKINREEQLIIYLNNDCENNAYFHLTKEEEEMLEYERTSKTFETYGFVDYITEENLAYQLERNLYGIGERSIEVRGDVINIRFSGGVDIATDIEYPECLYEIRLDKSKKFSNTLYVDYNQMISITAGITKNQIDIGYMTKERETELEIKARQFIEERYSPEELRELSNEEIKNLIYNSKIALTANEVAIECFSRKESRAVERFNDAREAVLESLQMATLLVLISNPGTAAIGYLSIAGGVCGIVDGAIWYAQGEEERGIFEIGCSMVEVAGGVKELKQAVELKQLIKEEERQLQNHLNELEKLKVVTPGMDEEGYLNWMNGQVNQENHLFKEWERKYGVRDISLESKPIKGGKYSLLPGEGDIGTYRDLLDAGEVGDNITPHHMPSAEYISQYGVPKKDGLCMNMEMPNPGTGGRHRLTDTYGRNMTDAEKAYYYSLPPRDALAYDINNLREIYQSHGLYSEIRPQLQQYIKESKRLFPELYQK